MTSRLPVNLNDLLHQRRVEGDRIEFKAGWNPDPILRTLCAFANDFENLGGGYVVIGQDCDESGIPFFPPVGLPEEQLDKIQRELLGFCNLIQPPYFPVLSLENVEGRCLIVLWAPGGQNRPYKVPRSVVAKRKEYRCYIRRYSSTVEARGDDERELISLTACVPFDDRFNQVASVEDLSVRLMVDFLREVGSELADEPTGLSAVSLGRQMNVAGGPEEAALPRNVGLLFFSEHPREFFPATQIDVVWFPEGAGGDRFEEKTFEGPLDRISKDALHYIQSTYLKQTVIKHDDRAEAERFWNFPYAAIEEAVINAVYHRSYEIREPIEVRITHEDFVVLSFPGPDRSIKMKDLRRGRGISRRYRNRRIGEFLKELELTEGRSTGISKILKAMKSNGSPVPEFETDEDRSFFLIRLPVHPKAVEPPPTVSQSGGLEVTEDVSGKTGTKLAPSRHQVDILHKCRDDSALVDLMAVTGRSDRTKFRDQVLRPLLDAGLIEMTIPDKPRSSKQRYRLTTKGRQWLKAGGKAP